MTRNFSKEDTGLIVIEEKDLTQLESSRLRRLELDIKDNFLGFVIVGLSLAEINEKRLYRTRGGRTFDEYCLQIWNINADRAYKFIKAALVIQNVENFLHSEMQVVDFITPQNEAQAKELAKLRPEEQGPVWIKLVEQAGKKSGKLTACRVKKAVGEFMGEKLKKALQQSPGIDSETNDKKILMSPEFEVAWMTLWEQVEKERMANWRYTSKSVVYKRTEIILEAIKETGIKTQRENEVAK